MAVMEINIVPLGTKTPSVSKYIAEALQELEKEKGIKYTLTSMGTIVEGELDVLLRIAKRMHRSAFSGEVKRVVTTIKIDERTDKKMTTEGKINSVRRRL